MKNHVKIILIVLLAVAGLSAILVAVSPYLAVVIEPLFLKSDLDNPIVNQAYSGWHEISLDGHLKIKLPKTWTISTGEQILIYDEYGNLVIRGEKFEEGLDASEKEARMLHLLTDCAGKPVSSFSYESFGTNRFANLASVSWLKIGNDEKITSVVLRHGTSAAEKDYYYRLCFTETSGAYCDEAEAIAWSMTDD